MATRSETVWKCDACGVEVRSPAYPHGWLVVAMVGIGSNLMSAAHHPKDLCSPGCVQEMAVGYLELRQA